MGQDGHVRDVVGVHDGHGMPGVVLGPRLVAEDPEGEDDHVEPTVAADDPVEDAALRREVVGVELDGVDGGRARLVYRARLGGEVGAASCREHHRRPGCQPPGHGEADLTAPAEYDDRLAHGAEDCHTAATRASYRRWCVRQTDVRTCEVPTTWAGAE